jgi:hypothetical protein
MQNSFWARVDLDGVLNISGRRSKGKRKVSNGSDKAVMRLTSGVLFK